MLLRKGKDNILQVQESQENIDTLGKQYTVYVAGHPLTCHDICLPISHKKAVSLRHWKDIGNKMIVWRCMERAFLTQYVAPDPESMLLSLGVFSDFDEETGVSCPFLFRYTKEQQQSLYARFALHPGVDINKVTCVDAAVLSTLSDVYELTSILYGLVLVYGTMDIRKEQLYGIKIHIPLFGSYLSYADYYDEWVHTLANMYGIYIHTQQQKTSYGMSYQMSINDSELLSTLAQWYNNSVASITKIRTKEWADAERMNLERFFVEKKVSISGDAIQWYKPLQTKR